MPVSLVLPCYNPQPGWEMVVCAGYRQFGVHSGVRAELIIVFDGDSNTVTEQAIDTIRKEVPNVKIVSYPNNRGKGYATRKGVSEATGDIILYTDIDFPYAAASMSEVYKKLEHNECDVAVGVKNDDYYKHVPFMRRVISRALRFFTGMLLAMPVTDTQCGLKGFRQSAKQMFLNTGIDRYLFDLEFIYKCYKAGNYRVKAIPVTLKENIKFRSMNYRILFPEMLNFVKVLFYTK